MDNPERYTARKLSPWKVVLPTILGLGMVAYFVFRDFDKINFFGFSFSYTAIAFILLAFLMMFCRDFGYVVRLRILSAGELSWVKCIRIILLWEFGSAVTPSAIGGTTVATLFIWKEGLNIGKSTSIVVATSFLDELYFSIMFPLILLLFSYKQLFFVQGTYNLTEKFFLFAMIGYGIKLFWTFLMGYSIFINPKMFASIIRWLFKWNILKKWRNAAVTMANNFEVSNKELKNKSFRFWLNAALMSFLSWTSRYWVLNFLLIALYYSLKFDNYANGLSLNEHLLIFAKQLVMWIMMLVMPTPGGSGFVETVFNSYMVEFVPLTGFVVIMALVWRLVSYYPYLFVGALIAPSWVNKNFRKGNKNSIK